MRYLAPLFLLTSCATHQSDADLYCKNALIWANYMDTLELDDIGQSQQLYYQNLCKGTQK